MTLNPLAKVYFVLVLFALISPRSSAQWARVPEIPEERTVYALLAASNTLYVGTDSLVYVGTAGGTQWFSGTAPSAGQGIVSTLLKHNGVLIAGMFQTGIFISTNDGASWQPFNAGLSGLGSTDISSLHVRRDSLIAGTFGAGVFATDADLAHTWSRIGDSLESYQGDNVFKMAVAGNTMLAGAGANGYMFRYTDNEPWWNPVPMGTPQPIGHIVTGMASDGVNVIAATDRHIYRSTDEGLSWETSAITIPPLTIQTALLLNRQMGYALSTTPLSSYLFSSTDGGVTWNAIGQYGLPNMFDIAVINDTLYIGGEGGLWKAPLPDLTTDVAGRIPEPSAFRLDQNYPNPFNPTTRIAFQIPVDGIASVKVYDMLGREMQTLVHEHVPAGRHVISFDGTGLASGMYFYRLEAAGYSATRRFLLLK